MTMNCCNLASLHSVVLKLRTKCLFSSDCSGFLVLSTCQGIAAKVSSWVHFRPIPCVIFPLPSIPVVRTSLVVWWLELGNWYESSCFFVWNRRLGTPCGLFNLFHIDLSVYVFLWCLQRGFASSAGEEVLTYEIDVPFEAHRIDPPSNTVETTKSEFFFHRIVHANLGNNFAWREIRFTTG